MNQKTLILILSLCLTATLCRAEDWPAATLNTTRGNSGAYSRARTAGRIAMRS